MNNCLLCGSSAAAHAAPMRQCAGIARIRKLAPAEVRRLILANRLPAREVA